MIKSKKLSKIKNLNHGFFNSVGGKSTNIYKSLNCGPGSKDLPSNIKKNLKIVKKKINKTSENIFLLSQIHSNKFVYIDDKYRSKIKPKADAVITNQKNLPIAVLTADCVPILFYDPNKEIIACVHAGWKGALNGIIKNTIMKFNELNSNSANLIAVVGPCIGKKNYKVRNDLIKKFIKKDKNNVKFFYKVSEENHTFDLRGFVNNEISKLKVKNIENIELDTFSEESFFYSYRRSCSNNEKDYGRCISVILMT